MSTAFISKTVYPSLLENEIDEPFYKKYDSFFFVKDTLNFVFNEDSLNYYYNQDISALDEYFENSYKDFDEKILLDSINSCFSKYGNEYAENLGCNLLKIGIKRDLPFAYAELGSYILLNSECLCSCNLYKGFLYLHRSTQLESFAGFESLARFYVYNELYKEAEKILIKASKLGSPISNYGLFSLYYSGFFHYGELLEPLTEFVDKEKGIIYLNKAVNLGFPQALFDKGNMLLKQASKESAFKLFTELYQKIKDDYDYGELYSAVLSTLERQFKKEWRKYKKQYEIN